MLTSNKRLESMVDAMAKLMPAINRDILYVMVLHQVGSLLCRCHVKVEAPDAETFPNFYSLVFSRMGGGKDRASDKVESYFFAKANKYLDEQEKQAYLTLQGKVKEEALKTYPDTEEDSKGRGRSLAAQFRQKYIEERMPRQLHGVLSHATAEGIAADKQAIKDHGIGCVRLVDSELGDTLCNMKEPERLLLKYLKEAWDKGDNKGKSIKADRFSKQVSGVPCNYMAFTTLSNIIDSKRAVSELLSLLKGGWARRSMIVYDKRISEYIAPTERWAIEHHAKEVAEVEALANEAQVFFESLAIRYNPRGKSSGCTLKYDYEANIARLTYSNQVYNDARAIVERVGFDTNESSALASLGWQAFRVAGIMAALDESDIVTTAHYNDARLVCERYFRQGVELERVLRNEKHVADNPLNSVFTQLLEGVVYKKTELRHALGGSKNTSDKFNEQVKMLEVMADEANLIFVQEPSKGNGAYKYSIIPKVHSETVPVAISISDDITKDYLWWPLEDEVSLQYTVETATKQNYSPSQFKDGYRKADKWLGGNTMLVFDVDDGTTLEQAQSMFIDTCCALLPTKSHQVAKDGQPPRDRFRVFLPMVEPINFTDAERFKRVMRNVAGAFKLTFDKATVDPSRFYFPSPPEALEKVWYSLHNGNYVDWRDFDHEEMSKEQTAIVVRKHNSTKTFRLGDDKDFVAKCAEKFMVNHYRQGNRNNALFRALSWLRDAGFSEHEASQALSGSVSSDPLPRDEERKVYRQVFKK